MNHRQFRHGDWQVSEIGYGMWGMGGWSGADDREAAAALDHAVKRGCTFFDTAAAYGDCHSERLLGALLARHPNHPVTVATKIAPKNRQWPGRATTPACDVFPAEHVIQATLDSLRNLGTDIIDLQQLHVWDDSWATDEGWQRGVEHLKTQGHIRAFGISVNRWEPANVLQVLRTGLVDAVQVVYNVFDQAPEDVLFGECRARGIAVIARVPFDEGSLTGTLTRASTWPEGDWRNLYFAPPKLAATLARVAPLQALAAQWNMTLPQLALRFILANPDVTTVIPGMRTMKHVDANLDVSALGPLREEQVAVLRAHRWDRAPDECP